MYQLTKILIAIGGALSAAGVIIGVILKVNAFCEHQKKQDEKTAALDKKIVDIRAENALVCYALSACLDGLQQLGANHTVTNAKDKLDKYLNTTAHK